MGYYTAECFGATIIFEAVSKFHVKEETILLRAQLYSKEITKKK